MEILNEFAFLLDALPSVQNRRFGFLDGGCSFGFRLLGTFFLLADGELVGGLLEHFQTNCTRGEVFVDLLRVGSPGLFQVLVWPKLEELKFELLYTIFSLYQRGR